MNEVEAYAKLHEVLSNARDLQGAARDAYLVTACGEDAALRNEVDELLVVGGDEDETAVFTETGLQRQRQLLEELADQAVADWLPERIAGYEIVRQIGQGGMGVVYEAKQQAPSRTVAIKLLHPMQATPERLRRFRHEAELLGRLQHPGIVQVFEAGMFDAGRGPQPFFAMELVDGVDIRTHCERHDLDLRGRIELLAQVCEAVHYAHEHGVVHRDLKPDNVLVNRLGHPRILDFGVARATDGTTALSTILTQHGQIVGTLAYMAPEQLDQLVEDVTPKADVYALGVLGFELLTGQLPRIVEDLSITKAIVLLSTTEPPRAGKVERALKGDVETVLGKALESEAARRYDSAAALAGDLRRHLAHEPIRARPPSRAYLLRKFTRRHRGLVAGAIATALTLVAGIVVAVVLAARADHNAALAAENENAAINGLHQSAQVLLDAGRPREALTQLQLVPQERRGIAWRLLERQTPHLIETAVSRWHFLDDLHVVGVDRQNGGSAIVYSLVEQRVVRELFVGAGLGGLRLPRGGGRIGLHGDGQQYSVFDLESGRVRGPFELFRVTGDMSSPRGHERVSEPWPQAKFRQPNFSADGRVAVVYTAPDVAEVRVSDEPVHVIRDLDIFAGVQVGPDGERFVVNRRDRVEAFDLATGTLCFRHRIRRGEGAAGYPVRGGLLLSNVYDRAVWNIERVIRRFDLTSGAVLEPVEPFAGGARFDHATMLEFSSSADGRVLATWTRAGDCGEAWLADAATGAPLDGPNLEVSESGRFSRLPFREGSGSAVSIAPSGGRAVVHNGLARGQVFELDPAGRQPNFDSRGVTLRGHGDDRGDAGWVYHVAVSGDGSMVASSAPLDPLVRVWDIRTGEQLAALERDASRHDDPTSGTWESLMAFAPGDEHLVLTTPYGGKGLCVVDWNLLTGEVRLPTAPRPKSESHLLSIDAFVAVARPGPRARLSQRVQLCDGTALAVFLAPAPGLAGMPRPAVGEGWRYVPGIDDGAPGIAVHPVQARVAVVRSEGYKDLGRLTVHDARTGTVLVERQLNSQPWCVAYSPNGGALAIGTNENRVLLFETDRHTQQLAFAAHDAYVYSLAWTPDGDRLVSASGDGTVRIWETRPRLQTRLEYERWQKLRMRTAGTADLASGYEGLVGEGRQAARAERIRRANAR